MRRKMTTNQGAAKNIIQIVPNPSMVSGRKLIAGMEQAKWNLAAEYKSALPDRLFRVAVNEAEALAWETEFPQLVFPTLAEEKIEAISAWYSHGGSLRSSYAMAV
jgi:hypothetical protein